jgi:hypothetical protein
VRINITQAAPEAFGNALGHHLQGSLGRLPAAPQAPSNKKN